MRKLYAGIVVVAVVAVAMTAKWSRALQDAPKADGYQPVVDHFWAQWEGTRPSEAVHTLSPDQGVWDQIGRAADDFQTNAGGKCLGHSEISQRSLGPNLHYLCYLAHYQPSPLRIEILCYKATDTWTVVGFRVDATPARWLAEASEMQLGSATAEGANNNAGQ
jgi:hypothetical protein